MTLAIFSYPSSERRRDDAFRPVEKLVFVLGAAGAGAVSGLIAAFSIGALPFWGMLLFSAPFFALALYFASRSGLVAGECGDLSSCIAAALSMALLAAWPLAFALISWGAPGLWFIPAAALTALTIFVVLWRNDQRAIYRAAAQAALIACIAVHSGVVSYLGS